MPLGRDQTNSQLTSEKRLRMGDRAVITAGLRRNTEVTVASSGGPVGYTVRMDDGQHVAVERDHLRPKEHRS
jgi:hypothetical protein